MRDRTNTQEAQYSLFDQAPEDVQENVSEAVPEVMSDETMSPEDRSWKIPGGMLLITKEALKRLPPLYGQEKAGEEAMIHVKLFTPDSSWTWYITEFDPQTGECFGLVDGFEKELGYFSLRELMEVRGPRGLYIERDLWWKPRPLSDLLSR